MLGQVDQDQPHQFTQVQAPNHLLEPTVERGTGQCPLYALSPLKSSKRNYCV